MDREQLIHIACLKARIFEDLVRSAGIRVMDAHKPAVLPPKRNLCVPGLKPKDFSRFFRSHLRRSPANCQNSCQGTVPMPFR